jgi:hypothetical protein
MVQALSDGNKYGYFSLLSKNYFTPRFHYLSNPTAQMDKSLCSPQRSIGIFRAACFTLLESNVCIMNRKTSTLIVPVHYHNNRCILLFSFQSTSKYILSVFLFNRIHPRLFLAMVPFWFSEDEENLYPMKVHGIAFLFYREWCIAWVVNGPRAPSLLSPQISK